jgi:hypothetical protein
MRSCAGRLAKHLGGVFELKSNGRHLSSLGAPMTSCSERLKSENNRQTHDRSFKLVCQHLFIHSHCLVYISYTDTNIDNKARS